jgi:hypothetical protein
MGWASQRVNEPRQNVRQDPPNQGQAEYEFTGRQKSFDLTSFCKGQGIVDRLDPTRRSECIARACGRRRKQRTKYVLVLYGSQHHKRARMRGRSPRCGRNSSGGSLSMLVSIQSYIAFGACSQLRSCERDQRGDGNELYLTPRKRSQTF